MFARSLLGEGAGDESLVPRTSSPELTLPSALAPSSIVYVPAKRKLVSLTTLIVRGVGTEFKF